MMHCDPKNYQVINKVYVCFIDVYSTIQCLLEFCILFYFIFYSNALDEERRSVSELTDALNSERARADELTSDLQKTLQQYQKLQQVCES